MRAAGQAPKSNPGSSWVLALALAFAGSAEAGTLVWTSGGPYGASTSLVAAHPTQPGTLFVVSDQGLFRSLDAAATWLPARVGLPTAAIKALGFDPAAPTTVYAATFSGVFKSTDLGATWAAASVGLPGSSVRALAVRTADPSRLYVGIQGVYRSTDGAATWSFAGAGVATDVRALALDQTSRATLYAGTYGSGVFKSTDGGSSWATANAGLTRLRVEALAVDPSDPMTVYAGTTQLASAAAAVFRSTDGGGSWAVTSGPVTQAVYSLAIDPRSPATLYAATFRGAYKTTDSGATWASAGLGTELVQSLAIDPVDPETLYAAGYFGGAYKSTNGGASWAAANAGIGGVSAQALAGDPAVPTTVYVGTDDRGVMRTTDAGAHWEPASTGLTESDVWALATPGAATGTVYAGTYRGAFRSTDSGDSWTPAGLATWVVSALETAPGDVSRLYAGCTLSNPTDFWGAVYRSTDSGVSWSSTLSGPAVRSLAVAPTLPSTLYAGTWGYGSAGTVYKSTDSGDSWQAAATGLVAANVDALAVDPSDAARLYAALAGNGVFRSTDSGASWVTSGLGSLSVASLAVNPNRSSWLYAGTTTAGVFASTDYGDTWRPVNAGLPGGAQVLSLELLPTAPLTAYAGLGNGSVWQSQPPPAGFVKGDLDGDGRADLLFRHTGDSTRHKVWRMEGVARAGELEVTPLTAGAQWRLRGIDDFDRDGRNDLVFWNADTGAVEFWLMNGSSRVGEPAPLVGAAPLETAWSPVATADFDADGQPDILWRNAQTLKLLIWTMLGTAKRAELVPFPDQAADANWTVVAALDYNHDAWPDLLWYNPDSGRVVVWYLDALAQRISGQFTAPPAAGDANWKVVASSDFSSTGGPGTPPEGAADLVWRNESSGSQVVWHLDFAANRVYGEFTQPPANSPPLDWTIVGPR